MLLTTANSSTRAFWGRSSRLRVCGRGKAALETEQKTSRTASSRKPRRWRRPCLRGAAPAAPQPLPAAPPGSGESVGTKWPPLPLRAARPGRSHGRAGERASERGASSTSRERGGLEHGLRPEHRLRAGTRARAAGGLASRRALLHNPRKPSRPGLSHLFPRALSRRRARCLRDARKDVQPALLSRPRPCGPPLRTRAGGHGGDAGAGPEKARPRARSPRPPDWAGGLTSTGNCAGPLRPCSPCPPFPCLFRGAQLTVGILSSLSVSCGGAEDVSPATGVGGHASLRVKFVEARERNALGRSRPSLLSPDISRGDPGARGPIVTTRSPEEAGVERAGIPNRKSRRAPGIGVTSSA